MTDEVTSYWGQELRRVVEQHSVVELARGLQDRIDELEDRVAQLEKEAADGAGHDREPE